jgi:hypothetical protein
VAGGYYKGGARGGTVTARGTPVSPQSFAKQAVFAHHYWLARRQIAVQRSVEIDSRRK